MSLEISSGDLMVPTFRVRSIYDVAIIKLLSDDLGYKLVQPSAEQSKIFGINENLNAHDIDITDILGGYGIKIEGDEEYVEEIISNIFDKIPNSIVLLHPVQLHAIYNGEIIHVNFEKNLSIVDIGEKINAILFNANYKKGQKVVVQVNELNVLGDQLPLCSDVIHFPGHHVILERDARFVRVSRKLSKEDRDDLFERGKKLRPHGHGLIMRTSAASVSDKDLTSEIQKLIQKSEELDLLISGSSYGPGILQPGQTVAHILFVQGAKQKMDEIRSVITPTFPLYHWFMSYSENLKITTTFAERISQDIEPEKLSKILKEVILEKDFSENSLIKEQSYSLIASPLDRILGQLNWDKDTMVIKRSFRASRGLHFAIDEPINSGDNVVTYIKEGCWTIHTKVYRKEKLMGEYIKIVTPVELYNEGYIRYIDLGVSLIKKEDEIEVQDTEIINDLAEKGMISSSFKEEVFLLVDKCKQLLDEGKEIINILDF